VPGAAAEVEHPGARLVQAAVDGGQGGQPFGGEQVLEHRAVEPGDAVPEVHAVVGVGDAGAGPERVGDGRGEQAQPEPELGGGAQVVRAVGVEQHGGVRLGQREGALVRVGGVRGDGEDAGGGLLFQPFPGVPLVDAGGLGQFGRVERGRAQRPVQAEPAAQFDGEEFGGAGEGAQQAAREGLGCGGGVSHAGHRAGVRVQRACTPLAPGLTSSAVEVAECRS
jgi:hypothetical protein